MRRNRPVLLAGLLVQDTLRGFVLVVIELVDRAGLVLCEKVHELFHTGRAVLLVRLLAKLLDHLSHQLVTRLLVRVTSVVGLGFTENALSVNVGLDVVRLVVTVLLGKGLVILVVINRRVVVVVVVRVVGGCEMICGVFSTTVVMIGASAGLGELLKLGTGCSAVVEVSLTVCFVVLVFFLATFLLVFRANSHSEANRFDR